MGLISLIWGIVALLWMILAFIPLLGWGNHVVRGGDEVAQRSSFGAVAKALEWE